MFGDNIVFLVFECNECGKVIGLNFPISTDPSKTDREHALGLFNKDKTVHEYCLANSHKFERPGTLSQKYHFRADLTDKSVLQPLTEREKLMRYKEIYDLSFDKHGFKEYLSKAKKKEKVKDGESYYYYVDGIVFIEVVIGGKLFYFANNK